MSRTKKVKTGLPGLDNILQDVRQGENIVWQIVDEDDYTYFAQRFAKQGIHEGRSVLYFRFSTGPRAVKEQEGLETVNMDMDAGFEDFTLDISRIIEKQEPGTYYIFDCLSSLQSMWAADYMVRNFFKALAPIIKELGGVGYFSMIPKKHSYYSTNQVKEASDICIYTISGPEGIYVQPLKAENRTSTTIFFPHIIKDEEDQEPRPLTNGIDSSKYYGLRKIKARNPGRRFLDNWDVFLMEAQNAMKEGSEEEKRWYEEKMHRMFIGKDQERENLFRENYTIQDYLDINMRLIGTGSIGGKAAGMLLSRKIVERNRPDLAEYMEAHDSYYIGSNVFYTFLMRNNWWKLWTEHKTEEGYFVAARALKSQIQYGEFSDVIKDKFRMMLDHYGQNPIIVRSSSLLEDGFGNAFAGKYDSVFCVNGGSPEERYEQFVKAVKEVYASAMDESALIYRKQRGLDKAEEQMAILVQRVSGSVFGDLFMPGAAGVGYSRNSYSWNKDLDPDAGVLRIVAGLGTRAVDRTFQDYPRLASLDRPLVRTSTLPEDRYRFVQRNVDVLDLTDNEMVTVPIDEVDEKAPGWYRNLIVEHDREAENRFSERGMDKKVISTSCENILKNEKIVKVMQDILRTIHEKYNYPVDIEYTINFNEEGDFLVNLLQCRPLQSKSTGIAGVSVPHVPEDRIFLKLYGNTMGGPTQRDIDMVAIVDPKGYAELPFKEKFAVANGIDAINAYAGQMRKKLMLMGPGRWGTNSAELGIPVKYAQISNTDALFEMSFESSGLVPELSFGSHFFQDMVEADIFYGAVFEKDSSEGRGSVFRPEVIRDAEGVEEIYDRIPAAICGLKDIIHVYDLGRNKLRLYADSKGEETVCILE